MLRILRIPGTFSTLIYPAILVYSFLMASHTESNLSTGFSTYSIGVAMLATVRIDQSQAMPRHPVLMTAYDTVETNTHSM